MSTRVIDGQLEVISCWEDDRLVEVRIDAADGNKWSATVRSPRGLAMSEPLRMGQLMTSDLYDFSGELPLQLAVGDNIEIRTEQEASNFTVDEASIRAQGPLSC